MTAILLLFITGALLLAAEVLLPGAIAGILGGIALLLGSIFTFSEFGALAGSLATVGALLLVALMLYLELVWLPRTKLGRAIVVEAKSDGQTHGPLASADIVGQLATAVTPLVPSGYVTIAGKRYEAFCRTGHAATGALLTVVGIDSFRLIVSETQTP